MNFGARGANTGNGTLTLVTADAPICETTDALSDSSEQSGTGSVSMIFSPPTFPFNLLIANVAAAAAESSTPIALALLLLLLLTL